MRIRSRLLVLMLAVLVPALVGAAIGVGYIYREEQAFNRASMAETARALAVALDREMTRRESLLKALAASPSLAEGDLARFYTHAATVSKEVDATLILSDLEGRQILNTRIPFGQPLPPMLKMERELRGQLGNEHTLISDMFASPSGRGPYSFAIQVPIRRDGRVMQFLSLAAFSRQLQTLLAEQQLPAGWNATIIDRRGVLAARNIEPEKFVGRPIVPELGRAMAASPEGIYEGVSLSGIATTAYFSRAPVSGWTFLVSVPQSAVYGPGTRAALLMGAIGVLLLALACLGAFSVARRISRPVESLRDAAERLGRNEVVAAERSGTDELDAVSQAMANASAGLRGATADLEQRIAEAMSRFEQSQRLLLQAQKMEAVGRLTGGIAHDFNNLLAVIANSLVVLERTEDADIRRRTLQAVRRAADRGATLTRQLLVFARASELQPASLDVRETLGRMESLLASSLRSDIRMEVHAPPDVWPVRADPTQLELAIVNLALNARDAMPRGGRVTLSARNMPAGSTSLDSDAVAVTLTDTGVGMPAEVAARAFEPFFTTKPVGAGSGLGLSQVYGFGKQSGGETRLETAPGKGTTVTLLLPRAPSAVGTAGDTPPARASRSGGARVLLVEDDDTVAWTTEALIREFGHEVVRARDAQEALDRLAGGEATDVVLSDIVMPGEKSGVDLARELAATRPALPVILVTGYAGAAGDAEGSAFELLRKPYDAGALSRALDKALSEAGPQPA